jgi:hypothetical protein
MFRKPLRLFLWLSLKAASWYIHHAPNQLESLFVLYDVTCLFFSSSPPPALTTFPVTLDCSFSLDPVFSVGAAGAILTHRSSLVTQ